MSSVSEYKIPPPFQSYVQEGALVVRSPGRINLIGEHTDYNEGFVLPGAIDKAVYTSSAKNQSNEIKLYSVDFKESIDVRIDDIRPIKGHWATYIFGVVHQFVKKGYQLDGFDMAIYGDVPVGAGLSSSAAIECAAAFSINELFGCGLDRKELALMAQKAEHEYAGVMCGIMDQFASLFGKAGFVIRLDCRSLEYEYIPFDPGDHQLVLIDSKVKHSLASSEYNIRRNECEEGVRLIRPKYPEVKALRDATMDMINECLDPKTKIYQRCKYVVEEIRRLQDGCRDLANGYLEAFGKKMFETHEGLSKEYEVSCKELDLLIESVKGSPDVTGARMMGGGFGGCTINLIKKDSVTRVTEQVLRNYKEKTGTEAGMYIVDIKDGTSIINQ